MKSVLIGSLVRDRGWILPYFSRCLSRISYNKKDIELLFILNNSEDNSREILCKFRDRYESECGSIKIEEKNFDDLKPDTRCGSRSHIYPVLAILRNDLISYFLKSNCDYFFMVDSDVLVKPNILTELLKLDSLAASAVIHNDYENGNYGNALNVINPETKEVEHILLKNAPDVFECDVSGACTLFKRELLEKGHVYKNNPCGEDLSFCLGLYEVGIKFKCKKGLVHGHMMNQKVLEERKEKNKQCKTSVL